MDAPEAEAAYRMAKRQLDARQITLDEYNKTIARLLYQDNTGTWWAISPAEGSWLKWNGSAWVPAFAEAVTGVSQVPLQRDPLTAVQQADGQPVLQEPAGPSSRIPAVSSLQGPAPAEPAGEVPLQPGLLTAAPAAALPSYAIPPEAETGQPVVPQPAAIVAPPVAAGIAIVVRHRAGIVSLLFGIVSWVCYPYILAILAIVMGGYSLCSAGKKAGSLDLPAVAAIIIALASMLVTVFLTGIVSPGSLLPHK